MLSKIHKWHINVEEFDVNKEKYMTDEQAAFAMYILLQILHADGSYTVENSEYFKKVSKALSEASEGSEIVPDSMMIEFLNSEYTKASEENHKLNLDDVRKKLLFTLFYLIPLIVIYHSISKTEYLQYLIEI